jgi:hypothetical protein
LTDKVTQIVMEAEPPAVSGRDGSRRGESIAIVRWTIVIAVASWGLNGITFWGLRAQREDSRQLLSVQISSQLDEQFDSPGMRRSRNRFAALLLDHEDAPDYRVLDFFDKAAMYVRLGALDHNTAHQQFSYWIERYWIAARDQIRAFRTRENAPDYYQDLEELYSEMRQEDRQFERRNQIQAEPSPAEIHSFLEEEAELDP